MTKKKMIVLTEEEIAKKYENDIREKIKQDYQKLLKETRFTINLFYTDKSYRYELNEKVKMLKRINQIKRVLSNNKAKMKLAIAFNEHRKLLTKILNKVYKIVYSYINHIIDIYKSEIKTLQYIIKNKITSTDRKALDYEYVKKQFKYRMNNFNCEVI